MQGIPQWCDVMDDWGSKLLGVVEAVAAMAALGFGLPADAFTSRMALGPHLLAPTGSDLQQHGQKGTVLAGACGLLIGLGTVRACCKPCGYISFHRQWNVALACLLMPSRHAWRWAHTCWHPLAVICSSMGRRAQC
jgi:hypothetical protein